MCSPVLFLYIFIQDYVHFWLLIIFNGSMVIRENISFHLSRVTFLKRIQCSLFHRGTDIENELEYLIYIYKKKLKDKMYWNKNFIPHWHLKTSLIKISERITEIGTWYYQIFDIHKVIPIGGHDMLIVALPQLTFSELWHNKTLKHPSVIIAMHAVHLIT